ncbi:hypothetical protein [Streptomyces sp. MUM 16J]|uniref:hypothetical protein n=1 Tax=Streptomyces sp. MUM 16J TaxID=2791988 RepID=UPI001F0393C0|nr:hypothetical protein [Streptomyces sp. MUM 16J]MCH0555807.1 hypothetical protein [Streptomyces sp. MUM 16J]
MKLPHLPRPQRPRRMLTDITDVAGIGCLVGAAWWWQPILGLIVTGVAIIGIGWAVDR